MVQDGQLSRREMAESLGLTKATRFVDAIEFGRARTKEGGASFAHGYLVGLEIPIFDWGTARVARAWKAA